MLLWLQYGFSKALAALWLNLPHAAGAQQVTAGTLQLAAGAQQLANGRRQGTTIAEQERQMRRLGNYSIRILGHLAMRLKERRRQKNEQEGAKRNETVGVWKIKLGVWEW